MDFEEFMQTVLELFPHGVVDMHPGGEISIWPGLTIDGEHKVVPIREEVPA